MFHIVVLIEVALVARFLAHDEGAHEGTHVAAALDVARVLSLYAIHIKAVVVELGSQNFRCVRPHIALLRHLSTTVLNAIADDANLLCIGRLELKGNRAVVVEERRTRVVSLENSLLGLCANSSEQHCCQKMQSFHT